MRVKLDREGEKRVKLDREGEMSKTRQRRRDE